MSKMKAIGKIRSRSRNNNRGDISLILAIMFGVVTIAIIVLQQLIAGQRIKILYQISDGTDTYEFNEINVWRLYYRNKAHLTLDEPISTGNVNVVVGGVSSVLSYLSTGRSLPDPASTGGAGATGAKFCAGSSHSKLCVGSKPILNQIGIGPGPWTNGHSEILASNADPGDQFGTAVGASIFNGQIQLAVGAPSEDSSSTTITNGPNGSPDNAKMDSGAVYVYLKGFVPGGPAWAQQAYIKASNSDANDFFGRSVSLSGDRLVVGAPGGSSSQTSITNGPNASADNNGNQSGAAYVYKLPGPGGNWVQEAYLKASNVDPNDSFGTSVAISGTTVAVGAIGESSNQTSITNGSMAANDNFKPRSGAVYVFQKKGSKWEREAYIKAANGSENSGFGTSISLSSDTLAVGDSADDCTQTTITNGASASLQNHDSTYSKSGAVYVYKRTAGSWAQEAYIKASDAAANDQFGMAVSIDGDTLAVGTPGRRRGQICAADPFGEWSCGPGAVYVYKRTLSSWTQEAILTGSKLRTVEDMFGVSVSLSSNRIAVGVYGHSSSPLNGHGSAVVFKRTGTAWVQEDLIGDAVTYCADSEFGKSIALVSNWPPGGSSENGGILFVGAAKAVGYMTAPDLANFCQNNPIAPHYGVVISHPYTAP